MIYCATSVVFNNKTSVHDFCFPSLLFPLEHCFNLLLLLYWDTKKENRIRTRPPSKRNEFSSFQIDFQLKCRWTGFRSSSGTSVTMWTQESALWSTKSGTIFTLKQKPNICFFTFVPSNDDTMRLQFEIITWMYYLFLLWIEC